MLIRPVTKADHASVLELAKAAGVGMTSLPQDPLVLDKKISNAVASFHGSPEKPHEENFLFVLEDPDTGKLVGTTGIFAHVGLSRPFFSYKLSTLVQRSANLGIYSQQKVLHMVNDYTGATEIGSLFLLPDYRRDGIGKFLSRARYLMMAEFPDLFSDTVISEIRGVQDKKGESPFYNNLGKHFFQVDFRTADFVSATQGSQFIADLMPKYPVYVALLHTDAQNVIGVPLKASLPALELLAQEGFRYEGYMDVFDAGPTVQAERNQIKTVMESRRMEIGKITDKVRSDPYMISNTSLENFRITLSGVAHTPAGFVTISKQTAKQLDVVEGDHIRFALS